MFYYLAWAMLSYIAGTFYDIMRYKGAVAFFAAALVLLPISFCIVEKLAFRKSLWILAIIPGFFFLGSILYEIKTDIKSSDLYDFSGKDVIICGTVVSVPKSFDSGVQFIVKTDSVTENGKTYKVTEKIKVSSPYKAQPASQIRFPGKLKEIKAPYNSTSFDSKSYYIKRGIYFSVYTEELTKNHEAVPISFAESAMLDFQILTDKYINNYDEETAAFLKGFILNNKSQIPDEKLDAMLRNGTYRCIYSPYLHISILLYIVSLIFKSVRRKTTAIICVLLAYLAFNIYIPSAWKICVFSITSYIILMKCRVRDIDSALCLTVLITGILSPVTVRENGFILSVVSTAILIKLAPAFSGRLSDLLRINNPTKFLTFYFLLVFATAPIAALCGYSITPLSYFLGLVLMPITVVIYILFSISFLIFKFTGFFTDAGIKFLVGLFSWISTITDSVPFAVFTPGRPGLIFTATYYLCFITAYKFILVRRSRKIWLTALSAAAICCCINTILSRNDAQIIFINTGQSDCAVVKMPGGKTFMFDGGGSADYSDYDIADKEIFPFLTANGIKRIDYAVLSHYHKDHIEGIIYALKNMEVGELFLPDYLPNSDYRDIIEKEASAKNVKLNFIKNEKTVSFAPDIHIDFYYTGLGTDKDENDNSLVSKLRYGNVSALFTGDITRKSENIIDTGKCNILKVAHHGSKTSSGKKFLEVVNPQFAVVTADTDNHYGFPRPEVVERLQVSGSEILQTGVLGEIYFVIDKNKIKRVHSFKEWFIYGGIKSRF